MKSSALYLTNSYKKSAVLYVQLELIELIGWLPHWDLCLAVLLPNHFRFVCLPLLCASHLIYKWLKASSCENLVPLQTFSIIYAFLQQWVYCSSALSAMNPCLLCVRSILCYTRMLHYFFAIAGLKLPKSLTVFVGDDLKRSYLEHITMMQWAE